MTTYRRWTEWEQPWSCADGRYQDYKAMTTPPFPGQVVALRQRPRPYLPTFSPWWIGLVVASVKDRVVRFENAPKMSASLDDYPLTTHWAVFAEQETS